MTEKKLKFVNNEMYEYEIYPLIDKYDPILTTKPEPFYFEGENRTPIIPRVLAVSLIETMVENYGIGLAANQCGIAYRVFVIGGEGYGQAFFNPEILETKGETSFEEGCLSFKGLFLPVKRPETVKIKYQDMNGVTKEQEFSGLTARIILHEYDHMEGIVFTSKVPKLLLDRAKTKIPSNLKKLGKQKLKEDKDAIIRKAIENLALEAKKKVTADQALGVSN